MDDIRDIRRVPANGLTLAYQSFGDPRDVPILPAELGADADVIGAALAAVDQPRSR